MGPPSTPGDRGDRGARASVAMSDQEVADFLASRRKLQVATVGAQGQPHLTTLFHVVAQGRVAFWTYARSQKAVNLRRDPRVSALVEDGDDYDQLRGVSITGRARLVEDPDAVLSLGLAVARRMLDLPETADLGEEGEAFVARQAAKRVGVVVEPEHVASWDHRKLG